MKTICLGMLIFGVVMAPTEAHAQQKSGTRTEETGDGYRYVFEDDPLDADLSAAEGVRLRVRPLGKRTLLIRPRVHFIPELFKSAQDL
jgi:hypothetical protein